MLSKVIIVVQCEESDGTHIHIVRGKYRDFTIKLKVRTIAQPPPDLEWYKYRAWGGEFSLIWIFELHDIENVSNESPHDTNGG